MENSEIIEEDKLAEVAKALGVSVEGIKQFSEEAVFNYFNSFHDNVVTTGSLFATNCTFDPLDKVVELYERLLQAEKDRVEYLEKLFKDK